MRFLQGLFISFAFGDITHHRNRPQDLACGIPHRGGRDLTVMQFPAGGKANDLFQVSDHFTLQGTQRRGFFNWARAAVRTIHFQACGEPFHLDRFGGREVKPMQSGWIHQRESLSGVGKPDLVVDAFHQRGEQVLFLAESGKQLPAFLRLAAVHQFRTPDLRLAASDRLHGLVGFSELHLKLFDLTQELLFRFVFHPHDLQCFNGMETLSQSLNRPEAQGSPGKQLVTTWHAASQKPSYYVLGRHSSFPAPKIGQIPPGIKIDQERLKNIMNSSGYRNHFSRMKIAYPGHGLMRII